MSDNLEINRPITGEINYSNSSTTKQLSAEEFLAAVDSILDLPGVEALRWRQYTPYFNDGEVCEFGVGEVAVRLAGIDEDAGDDEDGFVDCYDSVLDGIRYEYDEDTSRGYTRYTNRREVPIPGVTPRPDVRQALRDFPTSAVEHVCRANFGEHAVVTATKEGFEVEFYDHD